MKARFFSATDGWVNLIFVEYGKHEELQLYQAKKWSTVHDTLFAISPCGIAIPLLSRSVHEADVKFDNVRIPGSFDALVERSRQLIDERIENDTGVIPPEAIVFGYSQKQIDESMARHRARIEKERSERNERMRERDRKAAIARLEKQIKWQAEVASLLANDGQVGGEELADYARLLGIKVHPRTIGFLRKRCNWVTSGQASISGKRRSPQTMFKLYRECRELVLSLCPELKGKGAA